MIFSVIWNTRPFEIGSKLDAAPDPTSCACRKTPVGSAQAKDAESASPDTIPRKIFSGGETYPTVPPGLPLGQMKKRAVMNKGKLIYHA
ncbi:MAG: hypothetical protein ACO3VR_14960 [Lutimaribacter sp.]